MTANSAPRCSRTRGRSAWSLSGSRLMEPTAMAFSSELGSGLREESPLKQESLERRSRRSASIDLDDATLFHRKRQPAVLQGKCCFAEQLAAPALQRGDVGVIVGGDLFEIVDGGDHLAGDGVALRGHAQQDLQEFDGCCSIRVAARLFDFRQGRGVARQAALYGGHDIGAPFRAIESLRKRAQTS